MSVLTGTGPALVRITHLDIIVILPCRLDLKGPRERRCERDNPVLVYLHHLHRGHLVIVRVQQQDVKPEPGGVVSQIATHQRVAAMGSLETHLSPTAFCQRWRWIMCPVHQPVANVSGCPPETSGQRERPISLALLTPSQSKLPVSPSPHDLMHASQRASAFWPSFEPPEMSCGASTS